MKAAILDSIYILLKRIPISYALNYQGTDFDVRAGRDIFIREYLRQNPMRSEDEADYIYKLIMEYGKTLPRVVFRIIREIAEEYLYMHGTDICCHQEKIIEFRQLSMGIGQQLFISAFGAARKKRLGSEAVLAYETLIVKSDDLRLKHILDNGIAENHFHLNGSAPTAILSWICLMNHPSKRDKEFRKFEERRNFFPTVEEDRGESLQEHVIIAAAIRMLLYYALNDKRKETQKQQEWLWKWQQMYQGGIESVNELQLLIDSEHMFIDRDAVDYIRIPALRKRLFYPIAGERELLTRIFLYAWNENTCEEKWIGRMYAYLLIYCRFYGEMIQSNQTVGFYNFLRYQDRKEVFLDAYPRYSYQVKKMALELALEQENLLSLEARIAPKLTKKELVSQQKLFTGRIFACEKIRCMGCAFYDELEERCREEQCKKVFDRLFFVYHFVKLPDRVKEITDEKIDVGDIKCRHYELRRKNIWPIIREFSRLRKEDRIFDNIYGLDACNREIGCRPEVFAPYFRYAREQDTYLEHDLFGERKVPKLRITYHVGEDFLDVLDGLRAVEEAISFLDLRNGDRLGHAVVLGVNVRDWYNKKRMRIYLNRQDILDNTAFLYDMITRYRLNFPILQQELQFDFTRDFRIIYADMPDVSINDYILSMRLRGDEPGIYQEWEQNRSDKVLEGEWKSLHNAMTREADSNLTARHLIHKYHYDHRAKYEGSKPVERSVTEEYMEAVEQVQKIVCRHVAQMGIGIECNPSSNILIGMAKKYIDHPILRFNHYHLNVADDREMPEMFVSINTDDLGIFETDLENEYALMACALQQAKDASGLDQFSREEVYRWIDHIRRMGLEQSFKLFEKAEREKYGEN